MFNTVFTVSVQWPAASFTGSVTATGILPTLRSSPVLDAHTATISTPGRVSRTELTVVVVRSMTAKAFVIARAGVL